MTTPSPRTELGPLTTTWTPPGLCTYGVAVCDTCTTVWQAQTCNSASDAHDFTGCWPSVSGPQATVDPGVMLGWGLYSPAYVCPQGYSTAAMVAQGKDGVANGYGSWGVEYSMNQGETAIACCPSGFSISFIATFSTTGQTCVATLRSTTFSTVQCVSGVLTNFAAATVPRTANNIDLSSYVMYAPLYQLNFQAKDLPPGGLPGQTTTGSSATPTSASSNGNGSGSSPQSTSSIASQTIAPAKVTETIPGQTTITQTAAQSQIPWGAGADNSSQPASSNDSGGLSQGAKIGIGVGVGIGGLIAALLALLIIMRLARKRRDDKVATVASTEAGDHASASSEKRASPGDPNGAPGARTSAFASAPGAGPDAKVPLAAATGAGAGLAAGGAAAGGKHAQANNEPISELDGKPFYPELPTRLPSDRRPPGDPVRWRVSDADWVVSPHTDGSGTMGGPMPLVDEHGNVVTPSTPTRPHGNRLFELEGSERGSERGSVEGSTRGSVRGA